MDELLSRLKQLSPLPNGDSLSEQILVAYEEIINALDQFRDPQVIQPLIESVGYGTGYGLYWRVVHLLEQFAREQRDLVLISALQHPEPGSRMWAAIMVGRSRNKRAIPYLVALLRAPEELVRSHAVSALAAIGDPLMREHVEHLRDDPSREVRAAVERALR